MNDKRRRSLLSSQVKVLKSDSPITTCPNCGDDGFDVYSDMSTYTGYCEGCKSFTEHYHCDYYFDSEGEHCNTNWCSVCGRIPACPECGGSLRWKTNKCAFGTCDMWFYECQNCGHTIGDTGEDHVDCNEEDEPDTPDTPTEQEPVWVCATCGIGTHSMPSYDAELWNCPNCEVDEIKAYVCPKCESVFCSNCGHTLGG